MAAAATASVETAKMTPSGDATAAASASSSDAAAAAAEAIEPLTDIDGKVLSSKLEIGEEAGHINARTHPHNELTLKCVVVVVVVV